MHPWRHPKLVRLLQCTAVALKRAQDIVSLEDSLFIAMKFFAATRPFIFNRSSPIRCISPDYQDLTPESMSIFYHLSTIYLWYAGKPVILEEYGMKVSSQLHKSCILEYCLWHACQCKHISPDWYMPKTNDLCNYYQYQSSLIESNLLLQLRRNISDGRVCDVWLGRRQFKLDLVLGGTLFLLSGKPVMFLCIL